MICAVLLPTVPFQCFHLQFVLSDQVLIITQFEEIHVLVPEVNIGALILVASHFVQDAQVGDDLLGVKLLSYLAKELPLLLRQQVLVHAAVAAFGQYIIVISVVS